MPTIYSSTNDGFVSKTDFSSWSNARDATSGSATSTGNSYSYGVRARSVAGRGGTQRTVVRSFFEFDTRTITATPSSADLKIKGVGNGTADLIAVKSTQSSTLADTDIDAITGWSAGADNLGNVTQYSSEVTTWDTSGYNTISLNATALSDTVSLDTFKVCLIEYDYDLQNNEPSNTEYGSGVYYADSSGTSNDPYLEYIEAVTDNSIFFGANF